MTITVNGSERECASGTSLKGLIESCQLKPEITAAQVNDTIVQREDYASHVLEDGDAVELIRIVGGG